MREKEKVIYAIAAGFLFFIVLFIKYFSSYQEVLTLFTLILTGMYVAMQSEATKDLVKQNNMPIVGFSMFFDATNQGTYFQIINLSDKPATVWVVNRIQKDLKFPVGARNMIQTNPDYLMGAKSNEKLEIRIDIAPSINKNLRETVEERSYILRNGTWENSLGIKDIDWIKAKGL